MFKYSINAIDLAAKHGHIHILDWFENSGYEFKYEDAIINASENGHIKILDWFKNHYYELKNIKNAIHIAEQNKHYHIVD